MISPTQRLLPDNTQHSQESDIHAPGGIRTHNPRRRAPADPRLRPSGRRDWPHRNLVLLVTCFQWLINMRPGNFWGGRDTGATSGTYCSVLKFFILIELGNKWIFKAVIFWNMREQDGDLRNFCLPCMIVTTHETL